MPELPDLEVLKKKLQNFIGDSIISIDIRFPLTFRMMIEGTPQEILSGNTIEKISRRGKLLLFQFSGEVIMAINLMLTGRIIINTSTGHHPRNTVVRFSFFSGTVVYVADFKKMGKIYVTRSLEDIPQFTELGVEPLSPDFTPHYLTSICADERFIKLVLTDQRLIAGIGNSYSDEILFHAHINPRKKAISLTKNEIEVLYDSVIEVLENGISEIETRSDGEKRGKEIRDFFNVHGKKGKPCPVCGSTIREIAVSSRVTHVCPRCQGVTFP
jgi:formamidopyrimidine-DNA glycosylase